MRIRCLLALCLLLLGACFGPSYPVGLPCSENRTCPPGQTCDVDGICRLEPVPPDADLVCGNGRLDPGERCDDGNTMSGDSCPSDCTSDEPQCGNGLAETTLGEVCDDGNNVSGDGCSADCLSTEVCGNGYRDVGEACDDGNNVNGDGCSADCRVRGQCGNGMVDLDVEEQCDERGNTATCDADCTLPECGDGFLNPIAEEACDDGNAVNEDQCTAACAPASCSDGFQNADEIDTDCGGHCGPGSCDLGQNCGNDPDCASALCSAGRCAERPRLVFVTGELLDGNLGGLAGADAHCQRLAESAGLAGTYRAWLSDGRDSPSTRFTRSTGLYVLVDGTVIADGYADLSDGALDNPIALTERGADPPASSGNDCNTGTPTAVWSGTAANGGGVPVGASQLCQDWTSTAGNGQMGDAARFDSPDWSTACASVCTARASLYCIQQ